MEEFDIAQCWSRSSRRWLHWKIQVWLHSSKECCLASNSVSWRLWLFLLSCNGEYQSDRWSRWCYFTTSNFGAYRHYTKFVCTTKPQHQPCYLTYSSWERVEALCLQTFLVLTDKRGRSIWVDSLQAGPYGWSLYFCLVFTTLAFDTFCSLSYNT